jgi:predicted ATPase
MASSKRRAVLKAPFLKHLTLLPERMQADEYPFNLPILDGGRLALTFERPVTFFIGDNGTGKSTLLEAIARQCGFNLGGGNRDHVFGGTPHDMPLADALRLSWLPKVTDGFFLRAESFFNFATFLDANYKEWPPVRRRFGEKDLHLQSHGQSFFALFANRVGSDRRALYLLDEPEAALSPQRQIEFLGLLKRWDRSGNFQLIIATHSPIIMSYPNATLLSFDGGSIREARYTDTEHYKVTREFLIDHETQLEKILAEDSHADDADDE